MGQVSSKSECRFQRYQGSGQTTTTDDAIRDSKVRPSHSHRTKDCRWQKSKKKELTFFRPPIISTHSVHSSPIYLLNFKSLANKFEVAELLILYWQGKYYIVTCWFVCAHVDAYHGWAETVSCWLPSRFLLKGTWKMFLGVFAYLLLNMCVCVYVCVCVCA